MWHPSSKCLASVFQFLHGPASGPNNHQNHLTHLCLKKFMITFTRSQFNCLKEITDLITVNRFCANHSQLCSTFEIANSLPSSSVEGPGSNRHTTGITAGCQEAKYQRHNLDQVGWWLVILGTYKISWKFLVCMGWNSKHLYDYRISANEFLHEQVPGIVQGTPCLALPGEPGRLDCAVDSVDHIQLEYIGIFNFFHGSLAEAGPKLCFGLSIFGVLSWFGCQLSGLKSKLVNCHGGVSWFVMSLAGVRHLPIWFSICWKFVWDKNPAFLWRLQKGTVTTRSRSEYQMKSCPNWHAKLWVMMTPHRLCDDSMWRNPWFLKIQLNPFCSEKSGLKILPISISSEMTSFSSDG